jgi:hypothetical protein
MTSIQRLQTAGYPYADLAMHDDPTTLSFSSYLVKGALFHSRTEAALATGMFAARTNPAEPGGTWFSRAVVLPKGELTR